MDERLYLHTLARTPRDFVQRAFARQHHAVIAVRTRIPHARRAKARRLSAHMQLESGAELFNQRRAAQILHDHRVHARARRLQRRRREAIQLVFLN